MPQVSDWKDVLKIDKDLESYYSTAIMRMRECEAYWSVLYKIKTFREVEPYKPYKAMRKCQVAVDHIMSIGRNVLVPPWGDTEKVLSTAEKLQKWGRGVIQMIERQYVNPTRVNALHSFLYGMWVRRSPIFLKHKWPQRPSTLGMSAEEKKRVLAKYEQERAKAFPFTAIAVNPQNFRPDPNVIDPRYVIEHTRARASDIRAIWPKWGSHKNDSAEVDFIAYWSDTEVCIICDGLPVTDGVEENIMGFIPYEWGYSGLGNEDARASPEERIMGIVWPAISSLRAEARMKTVAVVLAEQFGYGKRTISHVPGNDLIISNDPSEIDVVPDYYNYQIRHPPMINQDIWRLLSMAEDDTDFYMTPKVLEGAWPRGIESGYQGAIQVGQARLITDGTQASLEAGLSKELQKCGRLVRDIIQDKVTVYGFPGGSVEATHVTPDDFKDNPVFFVKFEGETPEQLDRRMRIGLEMWVHNALSRETITREFFNKDWISERNKRILEKLMESNEVLAPMAAALVKAYGMERFKKDMEEALKSATKTERAAPPSGVNPDNFLLQKRLDQLGQSQALNSRPEVT